MKQINLKEWQQKTEELNKGLELRVGSKVVDPWGHNGIVVQIDIVENDHGFVSVWQKDRTNYGDDNCEHYSFELWRQLLRILPDA